MRTGARLSPPKRRKRACRGTLAPGSAAGGACGDRSAVRRSLRFRRDRIPPSASIEETLPPRHVLGCPSGRLRLRPMGGPLPRIAKLARSPVRSNAPASREAGYALRAGEPRQPRTLARLRARKLRRYAADDLSLLSSANFACQSARARLRSPFDLAAEALCRQTENLQET